MKLLTSPWGLCLAFLAGLLLMLIVGPQCVCPPVPDQHQGEGR